LLHYVKKQNSSQATWAHRVALIWVSVALSPTPAYANAACVRPQIQD